MANICEGRVREEGQEVHVESKTGDEAPSVDNNDDFQVRVRVSVFRINYVSLRCRRKLEFE